MSQRNGKVDIDKFFVKIILYYKSSEDLLV